MNLGRGGEIRARDGFKHKILKNRKGGGQNQTFWLFRESMWFEECHQSILWCGATGAEFWQYTKKAAFETTSNSYCKVQRAFRIIMNVLDWVAFKVSLKMPEVYRVKALKISVEIAQLISRSV